MSPPMFRPTRAEVDAGAISRNASRLLRAAGDGAQLCAVVKADGYGHGGVTAARATLAGGATWLAVALVEEGIALREAGIDAPILVLSEPPATAAAALLAADLTPTVYRPEFIEALIAAAPSGAGAVRVHVKLDTGMARVVQTHLARADEPDVPTTGEQFERFADGLRAVRAAGLAPRLAHVANTAATLLHAPAWRDVLATHAAGATPLVRAGIGLYGLDAGPQVAAQAHGLEPALRLVSAVSHVRELSAGTPVSYGHRWSAPTDGWLATVPIGYADGVPRPLTGSLDVLHAGVRRPVVGTITMDQLLVWCGDDVPRVGEEIVLIGSASAPAGGPAPDERIGMEDWARQLGTITYEIATGLSARVPRVVVA